MKLLGLFLGFGVGAWAHAAYAAPTSESLQDQVREDVAPLVARSTGHGEMTERGPRSGSGAGDETTTTFGVCRVAWGRQILSRLKGESAGLLVEQAVSIDLGPGKEIVDAVDVGSGLMDRTEVHGEIEYRLSGVSATSKRFWALESEYPCAAKSESREESLILSKGSLLIDRLCVRHNTSGSPQTVVYSRRTACRF